MGIEDFYCNDGYCDDYYRDIRIKFDKYVNRVFCLGSPKSIYGREYHEIVTVDNIDWYILYKFNDVHCFYGEGPSHIFEYSKYSFELKISDKKTREPDIKNIVQNEILKVSKEYDELIKHRDEDEDEYDPRRSRLESIIDYMDDWVKDDYTDYLKYKLCKGDILSSSKVIYELLARTDKSFMKNEKNIK